MHFSRDEALADYRVVTPAFFETLRVPGQARPCLPPSAILPRVPFVYVIDGNPSRAPISGARVPGAREYPCAGDFLPLWRNRQHSQKGTSNIADWKLGANLVFVSTTHDFPDYRFRDPHFD